MSVCHICSARPCLRESLYTSGLVSVSPSHRDSQFLQSKERPWEQSGDQVCQNEWGVYMGCWVNKEDMVKELQSGEPGEDGLVEHNLDVKDIILQETLLAVHGHVLGIIRGESARHNTYPEEKGTRFLFTFSRVDGVNACPLELTGIKVLVDLFTYSSWCHTGMIVWVQTGLTSLGMHQALGLVGSSQAGPVW